MNKLKKIIRVTMCDVVLQVGIWFFFILFKEVFDFKFKTLIVSCSILLFLFLLFYFFAFSRYIDRTNINNIKFHAVFLFNWMIFSVVNCFLLTNFESSGLIKYCGERCIIGGEEYLFFALALVVLSILIPIIYIFYLLFKPYKKIRTK